MRKLLILMSLICGLGLTAALSETLPPQPMPAPMRDAEGHFIVSNGVGTPESAVNDQVSEDGFDNVDPDAAAAEGGEISVENNPAAMAAESAARAEALKSAGAAPQPVTLSAKLVDDGPIIPAGLVWRIFSVDESNGGDIQLVAHSDQATAVASLSPGEYLIQAAYGFAQATDTMTVLDKPESRVLVLDAGALRLSAKITGGLAIPSHSLKFEVFPQGQQDDSRAVIVSNVQPDELIHLNAGVYHVVSKFGAVNAIAETDIRVDQGQLTDATMFHDAAQVSLKLVSEVGGEAIADIDWTIQDENGDAIYRFTGTFPSMILAKGDYTVFAKRGTTVYNRDFSVVPGPAEEIQVLTSF